MPTALVTGATGLVGSHIVERLQREDWRVRALVRSPFEARWLEAQGVELHTGDILDPSSFSRAAAGCDVLFHTAATVVTRGGWETFRSLNVEGTRHAVDAAAGAGARLLQVSSVAVYGPTARYRGAGHRTDESTPLSPLPPRALYARSKRESEAIALDAHRTGRVWATAIRPDVIYGPRDRQFTPRVARLLSSHVAPLVDGGRAVLAIVHAANVADAAVRAATSDVAGGKAYNTANDFDVTVREFVRLAAQGLGHRVLTPTVPLVVARAGLQVLRAMLALTGVGGGVVSASSLDLVTRDNPFSSDLAKRELGWSPTMRPEVGVPEAFRWWRLHRA